MGPTRGVVMAEMIGGIFATGPVWVMVLFMWKAEIG